MQSVIAANGDDARGSSLTILMIMGAGSLGTALVAPFILQGLATLAGAASLLVLGSLVLLAVIPAMPDAVPENASNTAG